MRCRLNLACSADSMITSPQVTATSDRIRGCSLRYTVPRSGLSALILSILFGGLRFAPPAAFPSLPRTAPLPTAFTGPVSAVVDRAADTWPAHLRWLDEHSGANRAGHQRAAAAGRVIYEMASPGAARTAVNGIRVCADHGVSALPALSEILLFHSLALLLLTSFKRRTQI
jgi:hypothetical protein